MLTPQATAYLLVSVPLQVPAFPFVQSGSVEPWKRQEFLITA